MCGIVGYVGHREVVPLLVDGLKKLEYRGYDSAGVVVVHDGELETVRAEGKLDRLVRSLAGRPIDGSLGLGHTRWATHGPPLERNAHPIVDSKRRIALIHNGIIENFLEIKRRLLKAGWSFTSDTDTEVVANLISSLLDDGDLRSAVTRACRQLEGMYAFAAVSRDLREIVVARQGPPLLLGLGDSEHFLASDPTALLAYTRQVIFLENGDVGRLTADGYEITDLDGGSVERQVQSLDWDPVQIEKGGFKHFMLKEIHEQPQALQDTLAARVDFELGKVGFPDFAVGPMRGRLLDGGSHRP